jgi:hypothetical protein
MLTQTATLDAACKAMNSKPLVRLTVRDKQWRWYYLLGSGETCTLQTAAARTSGGAWVRARISGGKLQTQRITDPTSAAQWAAWTDRLASGAQTDCAVGGDPADASVRAYVIHKSGSTYTLKAYLSADGGASWGAAEDIATGTLAITSCAAPNTTSTRAAAVVDGAIKIYAYSGGAWALVTTSSATTVTDYGIAHDYRSSTDYILWASTTGGDAYLRTLTYASATWSAVKVLAPLTTPAATQIPKWPALCYTGDRWAACYLDTFAGSLTYQTPTVVWSADFDHWSNPCHLDVGATAVRVNLHGEASYIAATCDLTSLRAKLYATSDSTKYLVNYTRVVSATRDEAEDYSHLAVKLQDDGTLDAGPLKPYAEVLLQVGYTTSAGAELVSQAAYHVTAAYKLTRDPKTHADHELQAVDGTDILRKYTWPDTMLWTNRTLRWLLAEMLLRSAGFSATDDAHAAWEYTLPAFTVMRGTNALAAVSRILRLAAARGRWKPDGSLYAFVAHAQTLTTAWSVGGEARRVRFAAGRPGETLARVTGQGTYAGQAQNPTLSQETGRAQAALWETDNVISDAHAAHAAAGLVDRGCAEATAAEVLINVVPGLELWDLVDVTDASQGLSAELMRVIRIQQQVGPAKASWDMLLTLEDA